MPQCQVGTFGKQNLGCGIFPMCGTVKGILINSADSGLNLACTEGILEQSHGTPNITVMPVFELVHLAAGPCLTSAKVSVKQRYALPLQSRSKYRISY